MLRKRVSKVEEITGKWFQSQQQVLQSYVAATQDTVKGSQMLLPLAPEQPAVACPTCGMYFSDLSSMRKHHARRQKISVVNPEVKSSVSRSDMNISDYMLDGMPTCRHCKKVFPRFRGFREHVTTHCPVLHGGIQTVEALTSNTMV